METGLNVRHLSPLFTWKDDKLNCSLALTEDAAYSKKAQGERKASTRTKNQNWSDLLALLIAHCQGNLQTTVTKLSIPGGEKIVFPEWGGISSYRRIREPSIRTLAGHRERASRDWRFCLTL
jgi:hypothetical protein